MFINETNSLKFYLCLGLYGSPVYMWIAISWARFCLRCVFVWVYVYVSVKGIVCGCENSFVIDKICLKWLVILDYYFQLM